MSNYVTLNRFGYTPQGTFGVIRVPTVDGKKFSCYTVERRWKENKQNISCIPEGWYPLRKRESPIVERTSNEKYTEGWEICNVLNRTFIMIHPANTIKGLKGCVAPGKELGFIYGMWAVTDSVNTFYELMEALNVRKEWEIKVQFKEA